MIYLSKCSITTSGMNEAFRTKGRRRKVFFSCYSTEEGCMGVTFSETLQVWECLYSLSDLTEVRLNIESLIGNYFPSKFWRNFSVVNNVALKKFIAILILDPLLEFSVFLDAFRFLFLFSTLLLPFVVLTILYDSVFSSSYTLVVFFLNFL